MLKEKRNMGFTLVELLAVIVILAIILVIAVPKVMSIIEDSKKATLESTAKMIASSAEKAFVQNTILDKQKGIECSDVVKINNQDYERCIIEFDNKGKAKVTIKGSGKFDNLNICAGDKTNIVATNNACEVEYTKASTYIEKLEAFTDNNGLITDTSPDKNVRYAGSNPNNKVYFNCKDKDSNNVAYGENNYDYANSCETWRIIGVFDVAKTKGGTTEKRIKIVREAFTDASGNIIGMSWDSSSNNGGTDNNSGWGINQWGKSTYADGSEYEGADLMRMLNTYYIGVENATCTYCNGENQGTCENNCSSSITPLSTTSLNMIEEALWYTGATAYAETITLPTMYAGERSTQNGKICTTGDYCTDNVTRTTTWEGKIGLIYPSDYGFASTDENCASDIYGSDSYCNESNWLHPSSGYYWTISPDANSIGADVVWYMSSPYRVGSYFAYIANGVRPVLYLSSDVKIIGGDGNMTPFKLSA